MLTGLQKRQHFEGFVERSKATRQAHDGITFFDEHELAREEVLHVNELCIARDDLVRRLLEREHDVEAHRAIAAGAAMAGLHHAG